MADSAYDPEALAKLQQLAGPDLVLRVLTTLHDELPTRLADAADAAAVRDAGRLIKAVHGLLSVSSYAGEQALRAAALEVERAARGEDWSAVPAHLEALSAAATVAAPRIAAALAARRAG